MNLPAKVSFAPEGGPESRIQVQVIYLGGFEKHWMGSIDVMHRRKGSLQWIVSPWGERAGMLTSHWLRLLLGVGGQSVNSLAPEACLKQEPSSLSQPKRRPSGQEDSQTFRRSWPWQSSPWKWEAPEFSWLIESTVHPASSKELPSHQQFHLLLVFHISLLSPVSLLSNRAYISHSSHLPLSHKTYNFSSSLYVSSGINFIFSLN